MSIIELQRTAELYSKDRLANTIEQGGDKIFPPDLLYIPLGEAARREAEATAFANAEALRKTQEEGVKPDIAAQQVELLRNLPDLQNGIGGIPGEQGEMAALGLEQGIPSADPSQMAQGPMPGQGPMPQQPPMMAAGGGMIPGYHRGGGIQPHEWVHGSGDRKHLHDENPGSDWVHPSEEPTLGSRAMESIGDFLVGSPDRFRANRSDFDRMGFDPTTGEPNVPRMHEYLASIGRGLGGGPGEEEGVGVIPTRLPLVGTDLGQVSTDPGEDIDEDIIQSAMGTLAGYPYSYAPTQESPAFPMETLTGDQRAELSPFTVGGFSSGEAAPQQSIEEIMRMMRLVYGDPTDQSGSEIPDSGEHFESLIDLIKGVEDTETGELVGGIESIMMGDATAREASEDRRRDVAQAKLDRARRRRNMGWQERDRQMESAKSMGEFTAGSALAEKLTGWAAALAGSPRNLIPAIAQVTRESSNTQRANFETMNQMYTNIFNLGFETQSQFDDALDQFEDLEGTIAEESETRGREGAMAVIQALIPVYVAMAREAGESRQATLDRANRVHIATEEANRAIQQFGLEQSLEAYSDIFSIDSMKTIMENVTGEFIKSDEVREIWVNMSNAAIAEFMQHMSTTIQSMHAQQSGRLPSATIP